MRKKCLRLERIIEELKNEFPDIEGEIRVYKNNIVFGLPRNIWISVLILDWDYWEIILGKNGQYTDEDKTLYYEPGEKEKLLGRVKKDIVTL